jgi:hypothetical protein
LQAAVAVSYFHRKIGPMTYFAYPEEALKEEEKIRLADIMDQAFQEGFFTHKFGTLFSMNYYFEIESQWARGNKEMLMVSVITDANPKSSVESLILSWCMDFATRLKSNKEVFKAFYSLEDAQVSPDDFQDIKKYSDNLRFWVKELYWMSIEELRERSEEEIWASIMSQPEIFKVIKKLSKGPMGLDDLQKWFEAIFPQYNLNDILQRLEKEKFVFINTIGQETYVLLVKDVNVMRVPPNCVIDLEEDSPELADLTEIYINEVRDFFEAYSPTPLDSLELFKLFADPKIYNVISQLREGPLPKEKILSMVSEKTTQSLLQNLSLLINKGIIQEFRYSGEYLYILKSDVVLTASFPEYLKKILPKESKDYIATRFDSRPATEETELKEAEVEIKQPEVEIKPEINIKTTHEETRSNGSSTYSLLDTMEFEDETNPESQKKIADSFRTLIGGEENEQPK